MHSSLKSLTNTLRFPMATSPKPILAFSHDNTPLLRHRSTTATASSTTGPDSGPKPIRSIPGAYGLPFVGAIKDRLDYFYNQGEDEFFRSRIKKYESTVFRANMPPGPFISHDPRVVVLLDQKSFPILFDVSKVEKKDVFTGTYMPSTNLTGGYRVLSYLDPSEPAHEKLKNLVFFLQMSTRDRVIPEFHASFSKLFDTLDSELATKGKAEYDDPSDQAAFNFIAKAWYRADPAQSEIGLNGPTMIQTWLGLQLAPITTLGLPKFLEELTFHSFPLPSFIIKKNYKKLYNFFYENSAPFLEEASRLGLSHEEACHNLLFVTCFNTFGGMKVTFPSLVTYIGAAGEKIHAELAREIRSAVKSAGGKVTMAAMEQMPLMKSTVYETLRINPPVPFQYGHAKQDLVVESHDAAFQVKKGEMLFGFQPIVTKDPVIFDRPEEFVPDRFVGDGERLLKHVLWSNGPETEEPTVNNKQCAGKDFVIFVSRLLVVELFLRYDSFTATTSGSKVTVTKLVKATS